MTGLRLGLSGLDQGEVKSAEISSRYKTVSRTESDFHLYLDGRFSTRHRARPIQSLNIGTQQEQVTFEIIPLSEIMPPGALALLWRLARPESLALSVGPMLATFFFCLAHRLEIHRGIALSSFVGVIFFHIALNLFNDYSDHMNGHDRLRVERGSRMIQQGWIRAVDVKRMGWAFLALAALCGLPAIILHFAPIAVVTVFALLTALEFAFQRLRLKYRGWAELVAFALAGPCLTLGYAWAISNQTLWLEAAVLGCIFGSITLMYFHSANFENIMVDSQAGRRTWATRSGFDASQLFFYFTVFLALSGTFVYGAAFERDSRWLLAFVVQAAFCWPLIRRVRRLASPLSSNLHGLRHQAIRLNWLTAACFIALFLWTSTDG